MNHDTQHESRSVRSAAQPPFFARCIVRSLALLLATSLLAPTFAVAQEGDERPSETVTISALNRVFDNIKTGFVPIEQGPIKILIASPAHRVQVFSNRITLRPSERWKDDGGVEARVQVDLEGWADLIATLETAAGTTPFKDKVTLDRQTVVAEAVVKLVPTEKGYDMTLLEALTPTVAVQIQSEMTRQLVDSCELVAAFLGGVACDAVSESLANIEAPLPAAGSQYEINAVFLSDEEKAIFDRYTVPGDAAAASSVN